jgi:hypothetical protein
MLLQQVLNAAQSRNMETKDIWTLIISGIGLLVSIATLVVVWIYTYETKKMQRAVTKQSEELSHQIRVSIMPTLLAELTRVQPDPNAEGFHDLGFRLRLTNEGNGIATNVEVESINIPRTSEEPMSDDLTDELRQLILNKRITFETIPFVRPKESAIPKHISRFGDHPSKIDFLGNLQEKYAENRVFDV